jgi:hypothetical protein
MKKQEKMPNNCLTFPSKMGFPINQRNPGYSPAFSPAAKSKFRTQTNPYAFQ